MADEELLVTLGVQDKGTNKQIGALNRELKGLDKEFKSANKTSKDFEKSTEGLKTKLSYLEKSYKANETKLDAYKKKMSETTEAIKNQQEKIANMKLKGQDTAKAEEQLQHMKNTLRETGRQATITENEMKKLANEIDNTNKTLKDNAINSYKDKLKDLKDSANETSDVFNKIGEKTKGFSLGATAIVGGLSALAIGAENDLGTLEAKLDTTGEETERLKQVALSVYSDGFGESLGSCVDDLVTLQQNLESTKNWTDETKTSILEQISTINELFNTTTDEVTRTLAVMQNSGLDDDIEHAMNVLTYGFQNGANYSDELLDTMREYSPQFVKLGLDSEEAMNYLITGAKNGAFNLDKVGDAMKELSIRVIDGSDTTVEGFTKIGLNADEMASKFSKGGERAKQALKETLQGITNIKDPLQQNLVGVDLFGTMWEDLGPSVVTSLAGVEGGLKNVDDATKKASESLQKTPAKEFEKALRETRTQLLPLGTSLLKLGTNVLPGVTDSLKAVTDIFNSLDDSTKENIAKMLLFSTTISPVASLTGKLSKGIGGLVDIFGKFSTKTTVAKTGLEGLSSASKLGALSFTGLSSALLPIGSILATVGAGIYAYNQYQDGMSKSCVTSREELGLLKSTLLELNGVHVKSREELEKSGLVYKELGNDIGEDFKNKVNESTKAINDFNYNLGIINMDGVLTEEETTGFYTRVDNMCTTAIESIKSKQATSQEEMGKMFTLEDGKIDESEQKVLEYLNKNYNTNIEEVTKLKEDVNKIYANANAEKRALNEDEIKDIQDKMSRIKQIELEALANNEQEQLFAKNEFINRVKQVDAEGAKELLIQQKKTLDEKNAQTLASYDTQIETMKIAKQKAVDEGNQQDADNLQTQIDNKTKERDAIIEKQRETWQGCIDVVNEMNPELKGLINQYTGEILSDADLKAQEGLDYARQHYDGLGAVTHDGWYKVKNEVTGAMEDCYVTVDKNSGQITGCWNQTRNIVGGYTEEFKNKVKELGEQHEIDRLKIQQAMGEIAQSHLDSKNQVVSANGEVIGSLQQVTTAEDGVKTGILDVNGTPMQIETNADGTITKMGEVKDSIDKIPNEKKFTFKAFFEKVGDWFNSIGQNATGTYNYQGGLSTVNEKGFELATNNNVRMLGSYNSNSLAYIPNGTGIRTHMQSVSDMKAEIRNQLNSIMLSGGYYNKNSSKAKQLVKNYANNYSSPEIDYNKLANVMLSVFQQGLSNVNTIVNVDVDANGIVNKSVNKTLDKLNRQNRSSRVAKGR
ncbi:phage tail tape measure protein [Clostridium botulinum]|nr:phage tail tape measure protein [Clostridium botulinum]